MKPQGGFTLLELLIAMAIFGFIGLACSTLFDGVLRTQRISQATERQLLDLQRALRIVEQDAVHAVAIPLLSQPDQALHVDGSTASWVRGNRPNALDLPRSAMAVVTYRVQDKVLWREVAPLENPSAIVKQALLSPVTEAHWRTFMGDWRDDAPRASQAEPVTLPQALELRLSTARYLDVRRVMLLSAQTL